jgi:hypothetical protein
MIQSKQAAMVRKCQQSNKKIPTSAQQSRAKDHNVILPTHKKRAVNKPPASRYWTALTFDHDVPLLDMQANTLINIYAIIRSSREAILISEVEDNNNWPAVRS